MVAACPFPAVRGTPIRIFRIADEIARLGHEVDVYTYHLGERSGERTFHIERTLDIRFYKKDSPGPSYVKLLVLDPLLALKVAKGLTKKRYDMVHAHHFEGLLAALPARLFRRIPIVFDVHTLMESELPYYELGLPKCLLTSIGRAFDIFLPRRAGHVIAVSEEIRERLIIGSDIPDDRISVIPNGVEPEFFAARAPGEPSGRDTRPCLVYAGNLAPYQGIDLLLLAFAKARQKRPDLRLRIITQSPFNEYEAMARKLGVRCHIELTRSSLENLPNHLAAADVAVNPRTACDGLPQKLLNYMAVGCPIVSYSGSAKYLQCEERGLVVSNYDTDAFANAILRLISDRELAYRLGANARAFVRKELSWTHTAERIEAVYAHLLEKSPRAL